MEGKGNPFHTRIEGNISVKGEITMRTLPFFFLFAFGLEMTFAQSGWFWQNPLPQGNTLWGVSFTDANTGTAVGGSGTILRTTNGGVAWVKDDRQSEIPRHFALLQNYPNPFNPSTTIRFELTKSSYVTLKIYNLIGQELETLFNGRLSPGEFEVEWNAASHPSGMYLYRMQAADFAEVKKLILLK